MTELLGELGDRGTFTDAERGVRVAQRVGRLRDAGLPSGCSIERYVQPEVKVVRRGSLRLFPISDLERWLDENSSSIVEDIGAARAR